MVLVNVLCPPDQVGVVVIKVLMNPDLLFLALQIQILPCMRLPSQEWQLIRLHDHNCFDITVICHIALAKDISLSFNKNGEGWHLEIELEHHLNNLLEQSQLSKNMD
jgi:hypothetical protein